MSESGGTMPSDWWRSCNRLLRSKRPDTSSTRISHDSAWETARRELPYPEATEYFDVPRGRILWDTAHQAGIIYHGNSTPAEVFDELAGLYRLRRWQARLDEHYLTGEALEEFYRLD